MVENVVRVLPKNGTATLVNGGNRNRRMRPRSCRMAVASVELTAES